MLISKTAVPLRVSDRQQAECEPLYVSIKWKINNREKVISLTVYSLAHTYLLDSIYNSAHIIVYVHHEASESFMVSWFKLWKSDAVAWPYFSKQACWESFAFYFWFHLNIWCIIGAHLACNSRLFFQPKGIKSISRLFFRLPVLMQLHPSCLIFKHKLNGGRGSRVRLMKV